MSAAWTTARLSPNRTKDDMSPPGRKHWTPQTIEGGASRAGDRSGRVTVLLSLYNGENWLNAQLDSLLAQTHHDWKLYWRDDGSTDASRAIMLSFAAHRGEGRCVEVASGAGRLGVTGSYLHLLEAIPPTPFAAFADQDDVWNPEKLAWALESLRKVPTGRPALYCGRQYLADASLGVIGESVALHHAPGFASALTQNIATGHTIVLNAEAQRLLREIPTPPRILHDWWAYMLTAGAGGDVLFDSRCVSHYRQHGHNTVGANPSVLRRGVNALRRGPQVFMSIFESNIRHLLDHRDALTSQAVALLHDLDQAHTLRQRLAVLRKWPELKRQTFAETSVFRLWYLMASRKDSTES